MIIIPILSTLVGILCIYLGFDILNDVRTGSNSSGYIYAGIEFALAGMCFWLALNLVTL